MYSSYFRNNLVYPTLYTVQNNLAAIYYYSWCRYQKVFLCNSD